MFHVCIPPFDSKNSEPPWMRYSEAKHWLDFDLGMTFRYAAISPTRMLDIPYFFGINLRKIAIDSSLAVCLVIVKLNTIR